MGCTTVQERYTPKVVGVDATVVVSKQAIGGFICVTSGTLTVYDYEGGVLVDALPVSAGIYHPLPMYLGPHGGSVEADDGASGTLLI